MSFDWGHLAWSLAYVIVPLAIAFTLEAAYVRDHALRRLVAFRPSVRLDVAYWVLYIGGAAAWLELLTPLGPLRRILDLHLQPLLPVGDYFHAAGYPVAATIVAFVVHDFAHYWAHRCCHRWAWLWRFHAVHHSADEMCLLTGARTTLTEHAFNGIVVLAIAGSLGLSIVSVAVILCIRRMIDVVQHSNLDFTYGPLGHVLASPVNHYYHHSREPQDRNCNYGNILALWDHVFGTAHPRMRAINRAWLHHERPPIGLAGAQGELYSGMRSLPLLQDWAIWKVLLTRGRRNHAPAFSLPEPPLPLGGESGR